MGLVIVKSDSLPTITKEIPPFLYPLRPTLYEKPFPKIPLNDHGIKRLSLPQITKDVTIDVVANER